MGRPLTPKDRARSLMAWYEGHTVPSRALQDEIEHQMNIAIADVLCREFKVLWRKKSSKRKGETK